MGRKVTIQIESIEAGMERFKTTWKSGKAQGGNSLPLTP